MIEKPEVKRIKWGDQAAHFGSCFVLTSITGGFGASVVLLWAYTREYYQTKITMIEVYRIQEIKEKPSFKEIVKKVRVFKLDLNVSYGGIAAGIIAGHYLFNWLF